MMRVLIILFLLIIVKNSFSMESECGAFFFKNGITAHFPVLKQRKTWEWYRKERPEYAWIAETGFYENKKFRGNGFGFAINIGSADLSKNTVKIGTLDELVDFSGKNAFLTKDSEFYSNATKREEIQFSTIVKAKVVDGMSIGIGLVDTRAVEMARLGEPTHMRLHAILPEQEESYTCFPEIEVVE